MTVPCQRGRDAAGLCLALPGGRGGRDSQEAFVGRPAARDDGEVLTAAPGASSGNRVWADGPLKTRSGGQPLTQRDCVLFHKKGETWTLSGM